MPRRARAFNSRSTLPKKTEGLLSFKTTYNRDVAYGCSKAEYPKEVRDKFLEKFAENPVLRTAAAHFVGVSLRTVENWIAKYEDFAEALEDILEEINDRVEETLLKGALGEIYISKEQVVALMGWLNAHRSKQYDPNRLRALDATSTAPISVHFHFNLPSGETPQLEAPKDVTPIVIDAEVIDVKS